MGQKETAVVYARHGLLMRCVQGNVHWSECGIEILLSLSRSVTSDLSLGSRVTALAKHFCQYTPKPKTAKLESATQSANGVRGHRFRRRLQTAAALRGRGEHRELAALESLGVRELRRCPHSPPRD